MALSGRGLDSSSARYRCPESRSYRFSWARDPGMNANEPNDRLRVTRVTSGATGVIFTGAGYDAKVGA